MARVPLEAQSAVDSAARARKREAIGLPPERPTAPERVYVPPEKGPVPWGGWASVGVMCLLAAGTLWMVLGVVGLR